MSIHAWIIVGLVSGYIAGTLVNRTGRGIVLDIVLGVTVALVGGLLFELVGDSGVTGLNVWGMLVALVGAVVVLTLRHALVGRQSVQK